MKQHTSLPFAFKVTHRIHYANQENQSTAGLWQMERTIKKGHVCSCLKTKAMKKPQENANTESA